MTVIFVDFFDMEFSLPPVDSGAYCMKLLQTHGVNSFVQALDERLKGNAHRNAHETIQSVLPFLCRELSLSFRDVESLVRSYIFTTRNVNGIHNRWPQLLSLLLVLRLKNYTLYSQFTQGQVGPKDVLDYIEAHYRALDTDRREQGFYQSCWIASITYLCIPESFKSHSQVFEELEQLRDDDKVTADYKHLSKRTLELSPDEKKYFFQDYDVESGKSAVSISSVKRAIDKLLQSIEL